MAIVTSDFDNEASTDLATLVSLAKRARLTPIVRYVAQKEQWAIYGPNALADNNGGKALYRSWQTAGAYLEACGVHYFAIDGR